MNEIGQAVQDAVINHVGELVTFVVTSLIALIKRKLDLRKLKKQGKLKE